MRLYQWIHLSTKHCHISAEKHSYCYCYYCYWEKTQRMDINRWMLTKLIVVLFHYIYLVAQSRQTLCDSMDCNQASLSMRFLKARILEWVAMPSSRGYSQHRIKPRSPHCRRILYHLKHQGSLYIYIYIYIV